MDPFAKPFTNFEMGVRLGISVTLLWVSAHHAKTTLKLLKQR